MFAKKKKRWKGCDLTFFKLFAIRIRSFSVFSFGGPNPDTRFGVSFFIPQRQECLCWPPWPNSQKKCSHRSGSVSPVSLQFFGMLQWLQLHKTHQNLPRLQKVTTFFHHKKKAKRTKLPLSSYPLFALAEICATFFGPDKRTVKFIPLNRGPRTQKRDRRGIFQPLFFSGHSLWMSNFCLLVAWMVGSVKLVVRLMCNSCQPTVDVQRSRISTSI